MPRKKVFIIAIILVVIIFGVWKVFVQKEEPTFTLVKVSRGNISQEVSETGTVKRGEAISLSFENAGKIEKIYVEVGQEVEAGQPLVKLEITALLIQFQEAQAVLAVAETKLEKLLAGATQEEIQVAQTNVENKQITLKNAEQDLEDVYEDSLNILEDSYLEAYNSLNLADSIQRTYFLALDQESLEVKDNKNKIEKAVSKIKLYLDTAKTNPTNENINSALSETKIALNAIADALRIIRENCEALIYQNTVTSSDKTSLNNQRADILTALTNITNSQQSIVSYKLAVDSAKGQLQAAEDDLAVLTASPRQEDINLYQAEVRQVQAQTNLLQNQITDTTLKSPTKGQIAKINKRIGEQVQPVLGDVIISLLPASPFQIEVDIYEEDIVKMKIGNQVDISLVAFPTQVFKGKVISIDPAEKIIEGVVYYEVTIDFEETPEGVKPGMTADLVIKTASKENVLIIPEDAIQKKNSKTIVEVCQNEEIEEKEVEVGLLGSDDMIEIVSGLNEGEEVIIP